MKKLNSIILKTDSVIPDAQVSRINDDLLNCGYIIVQNFNPQCGDIRRAFVDLCAKIGRPVPHDNTGTLVWDIKPKPIPDSFHPTFSEHNDGAGMHTDSQYRIDPEAFFGLLCIKRATCGGGQSQLLSLKDLKATLSFNAGGRQALKLLSTVKIPFLVPSIFRNSSEKHEYVLGKVFEGDDIRFRIDTVERAFEFFPDLVNEKIREAFLIVKEAVFNSPAKFQFDLQDNDILFVNNRRMLHGRTAFADLGRHLLRIRMNKTG
jgi:alpha-ketoglutarate-dependent taurine dioxygenase